MLGFIVVMAMMIGLIIAASIIYKKRTGRNLFIDWLNDIRNI